MENKTIQYASSGSNWIAIKYCAYIYLAPSTVNFYNVDIYDGSSPVYTNGYFCLYDPKMPPHGANGPHHMLEEVVDGKGTLCKDSDEITGVSEFVLHRIYKQKIRELRQEMQSVCKTNSEICQKEIDAINEIVVNKELRRELLEGVKLGTQTVREK